MKLKKKKFAFVLIPLVLIMLAGAITLTIFFAIDYRNRENFMDEATQVMKISCSASTTETLINSAVGRQVSDGRYVAAEKAAKAYAKDLWSVINQLNEVVSDKAVNTVLHIDNLLNDGKEFVESIKILTEAKTKLNTLKNEYDYLTSEDCAREYAEEGKLTKKQTDEFLKCTYDIVSSKSELYVGNMEVIKSTEQFIDNSLDALAVLIQNPSKWQVFDSGLHFFDEEVAQKYGEIVKLINEN